MNRRLSVWVVTALLGFAVAANGQTALPNGGLPPAVLTNATESLQDKQAISAFISDQMTGLAGTDPVAQTAARKNLLAQLSRGSTPAYYSAFSDSWSTAAKGVLAKNPSVAARLNIAIVTQALTDNGMVPDPEALVVTLINDKEPSVSLWGIKAAKPMVMVLLQLPAVGRKPAVLAHPTVPAVVDAVKRNADSDIAGLLATDAYGALVVNNMPTLTTAQAQAMATPLVNPILDILEFRLGQYQNGAHSSSDNSKLIAPQDPETEHVVGNFLFVQYSKGGLSVTTQQRIVQDLVNLMTFVGDRADFYAANKEELAQARVTLRYTASALKELSPPSDNALEWFLLNPSSTAEDIKSHTDKVFSQIKSDPNFKWLVKPPSVAPIQPPPSTDKPATPASPTATTR